MRLGLWVGVATVLYVRTETAAGIRAVRLVRLVRAFGRHRLCAFPCVGVVSTFLTLGIGGDLSS